MNPLFLVGIWLVATLVLVAVTQSFGVSEAAGDLTPHDAAPDFSLTGADPSAEPHPSALYGGVMWSVTEARALPAPELLVPSIVEVDLNLTNTLNETQLRVPDSMLGLVQLDGSAAASGRFVGSGSRLTIEPGETVGVTTSFQVGFTQEPDLAALGLRVVETNRIPATIPLDGPPAGDGYPVAVAIETGPAVLPDPDDASRQIVIEPRAAAIDINAGPYRAAEGARLAVVEILVQRTSSDDTSGFLDTGYWAIQAGGEASEPILVTRADQPAPNADQLTLLFAFPADAVDQLKLVASANSLAGGATFAMAVPR
jgi:hypothetical protein